MIEIHQAIFGQGRDQGHSLLRSSYKTDSLANQLSGYTDLVDRPQSGILSNPIVRGFMVKDHFMLVKSFPDVTGRAGRVFSHALILERKDFLKIRDISDLLQFHLPEIEKSYETTVIQYENKPLPSDNPASNRMIMATEALINHNDWENSIVWIGEEGYWEWICKIWRQLPDGVKTGLRLGNAFNAKHLDKDKLNLLIIPEAVLATWHKEGCAFIDDGNLDNLNKDLISYLLGQLKGESNLDKLLKEIQPHIVEIDDLRIINKYADLYADLEHPSSVSDMLIFADLVSRYSPNSETAIEPKRTIINALGKVITKASPTELLSLQHQTWKGYDQEFVSLTISSAIMKWLTANLFASVNISETSKIIAAAFAPDKKNLLHNTVFTFLKSTLQSWKSPHVEQIWQWLTTDPTCSEPLLMLLPNEAETDMAESVPDLPESIVNLVMSVAEKREWMHLLSMTAVKNLAGKEAFERVLDSPLLTEAHEYILTSMAEKIGVEQFLEDASKINSKMLIPTAVKVLKNKPALKGKRDLASAGWQEIWLKSIENGLEVWEGINEPKKRLFQIIDLILEGKPFSNALLKAIGRSQNASLKEYHRRDEAWSIIPIDCRHSFLVSTMKDCLSESGVKVETISSIEPALYASLEFPEIVAFIVSSHNIAVEQKFEFLANIRSFDEEHAALFVKGNKFKRDLAIKLGSFIYTRKWRRIAQYIFNNRDSRMDLEPALSKCSKLLSFWEKLHLTAIGYESKIISHDEFWDMLSIKTVELYPEGPNQNGLWERAGGDRSDLHTTGSAKTIWQNAISHIRRGGSPKKEKLLKHMIEDYSGDKALNNLMKLYEQDRNFNSSRS